MAGKYDDIINLPYNKSRTRSQMKLSDRAAQFSPFAALPTHSDAIKETGRLTSERITLHEDYRDILDSRFGIILENISEHPTITFTYFINDNYKSGGDYVEVTGKVKKIDSIEHIIYLEDGTKITMIDVVNISGDIF